MKVGQKLILIGCIASLVFIVSCATIIKGTKQDVSISSNPDRATVVVKTTGGVIEYNGITPAVVNLSKKNEYLVTISLLGYKETTIQISQSFEPWVIGNLICGGVIGIVIDAVDGAMYKLEPDQVMVSLVTATNGNFDTRPYVIFRALDSKGQLRSLNVPLVKDYSYSAK